MIKTLQNLDIYLFSLSILVMIAIKSTNSKNGKTSTSKAFSIIVLCNILIVLDDSLNILLDGMTGPYARTILVVTALFGYTLQILICFFWFWYAQLLALDEKRPRRMGIALEALPAILAVALAIASVFTGWIFGYDGANVYRRGPLFLCIPVLSYGYIVVGYAMMIRFRANIDRRHFIALMCFPVPPFVGGLLQTFFFGTSLIWSGTTLSLLIVYMAIQNELLLVDHLTGINNRMSFDRTLKRRIDTAKPQKPFALILIDLDNFQSINERYGHVAGDEALKATASILLQYFRKDGFVARFDGDEFAIIYEIQSLRDLSGIEDRLQPAIDEWNAASNHQWKISIALGYAPYMIDAKMTMDQFLMQVDKLLSLDKIAPKSGRFRQHRRR
jgi:diguanylate cyclase (GGDEF)-like protein